MVEAIFYVLRVAVARRDLPPCYGPWKSVYTRWRRWCALGLWQKILGLLSRRATGCLRFIDGSHIKLHQFGCNPAGGQSAQAIGRTKGGLTTKLCALVEGQGRLMAALVTPGQIYEVDAAAPLLNNLKRVLVVGDKGFDNDALRRQLLTQGCLACIPPKSNRRFPAWHHRGFIANGTKSKTSSKESKFISAYALDMKNWRTPFSILSSWQQFSIGLNDS